MWLLGPSPRVSTEKAPSAPMVVDATSPNAQACRCGTKMPGGSPSLQLRSLPKAISGMFEKQSFCSFACIRAEFLERLSIIEGLATPTAESMVVDLGEMYAYLSSSFATLVSEWSERIARRNSSSHPG